MGIIFLSTAFRSGTFYYDKICTYLASLKIAISAHLTNKKTTVLLNMTKVGLPKLLHWFSSQPRVNLVKSACHFPKNYNQAISLNRMWLFQLNQECQYIGIFASWAVIGWLPKDL